MLRKIQIRLTAFFFLISALILLGLSVFCLMISESNLYQNSFSSFQKQADTILTDLDSKTVITHEWLAKMESTGNIIHVTDNRSDFLWGTQTHSPQRQALITEIYDYCEKNNLIDSAVFYYSNSKTDKQDYFVCLSASHRQNSPLTILLLMPATRLEALLFRQRMLFTLVISGALAALLLLSWSYTGRLLKPIRESQNAQAAFVAAASHELRTPLSVILSAAESCQKADLIQQQHFLSIIQQEGKSMSHLLSELLTLSAAESKASVPFQCRIPCIKESAPAAAVEPDTFLLDIYETFEPLSRKTGHILRISLPEQKITPIRYDTERIRQVFSILLHNAFSYTPPGSTIHLGISCNTKTLTFLVADNGPGIPDTQKELIFRKFYRADLSHSQDGHFGLGLPIAEQIVKAQDGKLSVSDTPGGGATFHLTLPIR